MKPSDVAMVVAESHGLLPIVKHVLAKNAERELRIEEELDKEVERITSKKPIKKAKTKLSSMRHSPSLTWQAPKD